MKKYAIKLANPMYGYFIMRETEGFLTTTTDLNDVRCHFDLEKATRILNNTLSFGLQYRYSNGNAKHEIIEIN